MSQNERITSDKATVSTLIADTTIVVGAVTLLLGAWAFLFPAHFFDDFPISGADWVSTLGDYNEHLMRDYGSAQVGLGLAAVIVGARRSRTGTGAVLWGLVIFGSLHFGYHVGTFGLFDTVSAVSQAVTLATVIVIPLVLLWGLRRG